MNLAYSLACFSLSIGYFSGFIAKDIEGALIFGYFPLLFGFLLLWRNL